MKKSILFSALILSASLAQSQQPSGQQAAPRAPSAPRSGGVNAQPGNNAPQQGTAQQPATNPRRGINLNLPPEAGRERVLLDPQNRPGVGGTNQATLATTNRPFGTTNLPFAATNQIGFGRTNGQLPFSTNVGPSPIAGTGTIVNDASGTQKGVGAPATVPGGPSSDRLNQAALASDQAFNQRLGAALLQTGATQIFFPLTRSSVNVLNQKGVVTLQGNVASEAERQSIEARVRSMQGVTGINNQLQVAGQSRVKPQGGVSSNQGGVNPPARNTVNPAGATNRLR